MKPFRILTIATLLALTACTPAPVFKTSAPTPMLTPLDATVDADHYRNSQVVWGGEVIEVHNRSDVSEIVILAYPLDAGQRPQRGDNGLGRFIAILPGYVESYDYPPGRFVTITGKLNGSREDLIDEQRYRYAIVSADETHLWPVDFDERKWHIGIGVSGGIR
jgi:outer membrane lipoprotein